jgi:hypothetical protein
MNRKYFGISYIFIYSVLLGSIDSIIGSKPDSNTFSFETLSMRILVIFVYWVIVKQIAAFAVSKGHSYKLAMIAGIIGLPIIGYLLAMLALNLL